jgi:hypothetical protein
MTTFGTFEAENGDDVELALDEINPPASTRPPSKNANAPLSANTGRGPDIRVGEDVELDRPTGPDRLHAREPLGSEELAA